MKSLVLYHAGCMDGWCSAWVAHKYFGDNAEYVPVQYGQEPPDVKDREVLILDFSYKKPVLERMARDAFTITILDHHKTAAEDLSGGYDAGRAGYRIILPRVWARFEIGKSGGRLTCEHFFPDQAPPWLVDLTEDRDLWLWKLPFSREMNAALASYPRTFEEWDRLAQEVIPVERLASEGAAILRYQQQLVGAHCEHAVETEIDGHKVLAVNATCLMSEIAGKLAEGRPFGATWFVREDGKKQWSLRSREGGIDVSEVAKRHGGGGHRQAAGFEESV